MKDEKYKIFCVHCDWSAEYKHDRILWTTFTRCPMCNNPTDAINVREF